MKSKICALGLLATIAFAAPIHLDFNTGVFGSELSFTLVNVLAPGTNIPFASFTPPTPRLDDFTADTGDLGNSVNYTFQWDLAPGDYNFTVFDSFGDGGNGLNYELKVDGVTAFSGNFPSSSGSSEEKSFSVAGGGVPEPATIGVVALGLAGMAIWRRRRAA